MNSTLQTLLNNTAVLQEVQHYLIGDMLTVVQEQIIENTTVLRTTFGITELDNVNSPTTDEQNAINALDPALTPLCVSFVGMQETTSRAFGLYNIEEALCDDLPLHSTVSLQTIAVHGFRPVMV